MLLHRHIFPPCDRTPKLRRDGTVDVSKIHGAHPNEAADMGSSAEKSGSYEELTWRPTVDRVYVLVRGDVGDLAGHLQTLHGVYHASRARLQLTWQSSGDLSIWSTNVKALGHVLSAVPFGSDHNSSSRVVAHSPFLANLLLHIPH